jgi:DNA polymerase I-like protein with 3'-5' exonuclease and polymerase domains
MKMAMIAVEAKLQQREEGRGKREEKSDDVIIQNPLGVQVLQIHDSILVECPRENAEKVGEILKSTMENIYPDLAIKLQVDVHVGENWGEV